MPTLLLAVLLTVLVSSRRPGMGAEPRPSRRGTIAAVLLLAFGIIASWAGDVLLGPSLLVGVGCFALAHVLYIVAFNGRAAARRLPLWTLGYVPVLVGIVVLLWEGLGDLRVVMLGYGLVLVATAMTSARVNRLAALGGGLFLASDALLAFRLFDPAFATVFPDPWQDLTIMSCYCIGQGLIALGLLRRLVGPAPRAAV